MMDKTRKAMKSLGQAAEKDVSNEAEKAKQAVREEFAKASSTLKKHQQQFEKYVDENPKKAALVVVGIGAAVGAAIAAALLKKRKKQKRK